MNVLLCVARPSDDPIHHPRINDSSSLDASRPNSYRQHPASGGFACAEKGCKCAGFFYIFAEGAFILRCRCKHKAQEHDAAATPYACARAGCKCAAFDSPWVCNCDHAWAAHAQRVVEVDLNAAGASSLLASASEFQVRALERER